MTDKPDAPPPASASSLGTATPTPAPKPIVKPPAPPAAKAPEPMSKDELAARVAASRGAQVTLDPDSDAALAARGAMGDTIEANTQARDVALIAEGFDPNAPSAHLTDLTPEQIEARAGKSPTPKPAA